ncbi:hypothetical protein GTN66_02535 [bacterium]|nr:hypothetical protein [bacterium]NIN92110.1 hypothetical protein [bacterium]NIO18316.1 hypothetical protein [bacterium]NIO73281.1 hypothetical protein [bacterium]
MIKCPKCGYENKDDALYCGMCYEPFRKKAEPPEFPDPEAEKVSSLQKDACINHPDRPAQGFCAVCQRDFCFECLQEKDGRLVCNQCYAGATPQGARYRQKITRDQYEQYGIIAPEKGFFRKCWEIVIYPRKFFAELPQEGGFGAPIKFYIIALGLLLAAICMPTLIFSLNRPVGSSVATIGVAILFFVFSLVGLLGILGLFINAGIYHFFVKLFGGKKGYEQTFRVATYTAVASTVWTIGLYLLLLIFVGGDLLSAFLAAGATRSPEVILYFAGQFMSSLLFWTIIYVLFWLYVTFVVQVEGFKKFQVLTTVKAVGVVICPVVFWALFSFLIPKREKVLYRKEHEIKQIHYQIEGYDVLPGVSAQI